MSQQLAARVPVGFRFHPTDEELVGYYLPKKVGARKIDLDLILDLDLYKLEPWDLQELCKIQADSNEKQTDYYFFSRKDKKYPTGNRANRATSKGFWKATGRDKPIHTKLQALIGMRKTLVFYQGRAPHGVKTDWIMHEFRLDDGPGRPAHDGGWVVCRVFKKNKNLKMKMQERAVSYEEQVGLVPDTMGSPDILSGGIPMTRFAFLDHSPFHAAAAESVKREVINLDEYQAYQPDQYHHLSNFSSQLGIPSTKTESHSMPSSSEVRSYLTRALSLQRVPDVDYLVNPYPESSLFNSAFTNELSDPQTSGSVDAENVPEEDQVISGLENVDWSALLEPAVALPAAAAAAAASKDLVRCPSLTSTKSVVTDPCDVTMLVQLKRQNSDMFSSLDLWNYSQVAQQM